MTVKFAKVALATALRDAERFAAAAGWGENSRSTLWALSCTADWDAQDVLEEMGDKVETEATKE